MPRIKRGLTSHKKHKKILKLTRGHMFGRSKTIKQAKESLLHAGQYAFAGRKKRKRDFRKLWITQINIALRNEGLSYAKFMASLKAKNINLDRKTLAELAVKDASAFKEVISKVT